jgi:hypothetical protein
MRMQVWENARARPENLPKQVAGRASVENFMQMAAAAALAQDHEHASRRISKA